MITCHVISCDQISKLSTHAMPALALRSSLARPGRVQVCGTAQERWLGAWEHVVQS